MKKTVILIGITLFVVGCSSNQNKEQMLFDAAKACNKICEDNPSISHVSSSAGAGLPLLAVGGMETSCECQRN